MGTVFTPLLLAYSLSLEGLIVDRKVVLGISKTM